MSQEKEKRTEIGEIGEFGLIDRISKSFGHKNPETLVGIGDDAAVIESGAKVKLVTTDMLVEGVHFDLSYIPLQHLGYKSVAVNVSDIAAMNGKPKQITVSLGLSNRFSVEAVESFYEGVKFACEDYAVDLIGGDTTSSPTGLIISVTAIGEASKEQVSYRKNAEENDIICVTGDLGGALMGLTVLEREKEVFKTNPEMQPDISAYEYIVKRQLKPSARMDVIFELEEAGVVPTSMIDVSDGLASELFHIAKQSEVGITIYEDKLPIDEVTYNTAVEFKMDPVTCVLNGGEDYELLFTISQTDFEKIKNLPDVSAIGYIDKKENGHKLVTKGGNTVPLQAQGWKHF
ncbi:MULTISPECIES: thiamine-phosphate kinase [Reichenbachiella]|uniref:Thiamine-monophosphate kinase n=1 Tax=Reichenbachiella agariperforans TaxID=156994 RepID=A0A1M6VIV2_REIAG|nr:MULTISPECIES: thiamine-phosphate kinase [Reichenbachiella]MBU2914446.1 thiamine-phosphate kinase [Reichenbachiella agariperforans]RJE75297.1 thiamine-phosphate kinase [Reichenbachiella sp. MSK19-1]SHK81432.1 thiamine-phosphate kinase [Reichenbachiella agariperforans]